MTAPPSARCWRAPAIAFAPRTESGKGFLRPGFTPQGVRPVCRVPDDLRRRCNLSSVGGRTDVPRRSMDTDASDSDGVRPSRTFRYRASGPGYRAPACGRERDRAPGTLPVVCHISGTGRPVAVGRSWDFTERAPAQTVFRFSPKPGVPQRFRNHMTGENGVSRCGDVRPPGRFGGRSSRLQESVRRAGVDRGWRQDRAAQASRDCRAALTYPCSTNHRAESAMASVAGREV
jgi:hypothetical protein